jgi:pathogenesis-related protein 1
MHVIQKWNSDLAALGQKWADGCLFEHGQPPFSASQVGHKSLGQNLYASSDLSKSVADGVQAWFDEKADYTYNTLACRPGKACGHYTQVRTADYCCTWRCQDLQVERRT